LDGRIDPEEGGDDQPELGRAEPEFRLHQWSGDADGAAVDVVEEHRSAEQHHQQRRAAALRYGVQ
jgi:hypothetical protein